MHLICLLAVALTAVTARAGELTIPANCRQLIWVTTANWASPAAKLQRWKRSGPTASWEKVGDPMSALVGERGLGWGLGLLRIPSEAAPRKVEGDRRAPAGLFELTGTFGRSRSPVGKLPWRTITPTLEAIDDPHSRFYNRLVDRREVAQVDWRSSEPMAKIPDYAMGVVVAHNPENRPGAGSCIFLHLWLGKRRGTAGCTILREPDLRQLVRWLDPAARPLLLQLPQPVAERELRGF